MLIVATGALCTLAAAASSSVVFSRAYAPTPRAAQLRLYASPTLKDDLLGAIGDDGWQSFRGSVDEVNEAILALSQVSPTPMPARSPLLNGKWELQYAGTPGSGFLQSPTRMFALALYTPFSPSILSASLTSLPLVGASVGPLSVTIASMEAGEPRVTAETTVSILGGAPQPLALRSNLSPRSDVALREDFVEAQLFSTTSPLPGPLAISRTLYVVYVDKDLLIVRDESGVPSVFARQDKFPAAGEPSFAEDDDAPGAG
jgi:hypothetical protein